MNTIRTARLTLAPVSPSDLPDLIRFKSDPMIYAQMLGGIRLPMQTAEELAEEMVFWAARGIGMWSVRTISSPDLIGLTGLHERPDGRGLALRFAFDPAARGYGLAREAAGAALRFAHERAGISRVVAVARQSNIGSRTVLGAIGMQVCGHFDRGGEEMVVYQSLGGRTASR